ncbi:MAG TPA: hypothetical protein VES65_08605 [Solirubrobacteraceae bacterium]|nr:hypothetical protein [Solirubrobacteraceae bacterium]
MIQVNFSTFKSDSEAKEWIKLPVAQLIAGRDEVAISGPHADWINPDLAIIDPETRERVTRADGAERWARLLPFAFRSGDIDVEVSEVVAAEPADVAFHYSTAA